MNAVLFFSTTEQLVTKRHPVMFGSEWLASGASLRGELKGSSGEGRLEAFSAARVRAQGARVRRDAAVALNPVHAVGVATAAVDHLLLGELCELVAASRPRALDVGDAGEGLARGASTLRRGRRHGTLDDPVNLACSLLPGWERDGVDPTRRAAVVPRVVLGHVVGLRCGRRGAKRETAGEDGHEFWHDRGWIG